MNRSAHSHHLRRCVAVLCLMAGSALSIPPSGVGAASSASLFPNRFAAGWGHNCAIDDAAEIRCWGFNDSGQLGYAQGIGVDIVIGDNETPASVGVVDVGGEASALAAGDMHTCARLTGGAVRCWGAGGDGRLGFGGTGNVGDDETPGSFDFRPTTGGVNDPIDLGPGRTATAIAAGGRHTCAILDNGRVRCWGDGSDGQLGYGDLDGDGAPDDVGDNELPGDVGTVDLGPGRTAVQIAAGYEFTCVIMDNFKVKCWGDGGYGQLGYGNADSVGVTNVPDDVGTVRLGSGRTARGIDAGSFHTCVIMDNDRLKCWGHNDDGQLGYGNEDPVGLTNDPSAVGTVHLGAGRTAKFVSAGGFHTCAVLDDDSLRCWGKNNIGQLGHADTIDIGDDETPATVNPVDLGGDATAVETGLDHTCAIVSTGDAHCWGAPFYGQLGYASGNNTTDAVGDDETPATAGPINLGAPMTIPFIPPEQPVVIGP